MKKYTAIGIMCICSAIIGGSTAVMFAAKPPVSNEPYYLKDTDGKVALYETASQNPITKYDIYTRLLPFPDAEALRYGIAVHSPEELSRLLEDFGL